MPTINMKPARTPPFPYPTTPGSRFRTYLTGPHFASSSQLTLGVLFLSLFVVVDKLRFPMSCQAAVVYAALAVQLFPNPAMGGRIAASLVAASCICIGAAAGGGAVAAAWAATGAGDRSLVTEVKKIIAGPPSPAKSALLSKVAAAQSAARGAATGAAVAAKPTLGQAVAVLNEGIVPLVGPAFYGTLCVAGAAVMAVFATVRCDPANPAVASLGSILALLAGLVVANAGAVPILGIRTFFQKVVKDIIVMGLVASAAVLVSGVIILPSKASAALTRTLATALEGVGQSISGLGATAPGGGVVADATAAPRADPPRSPRAADDGPALHSTAAADVAAVLRAALARGRSARLPDITDDALLARVRADSAATTVAAAPERPRPAPAGSDIAPPVVTWRGLLARARTELAEASFEPPFLFNAEAGTSFRPARWKTVLASADAVISQAAALEELVQRVQSAHGGSAAAAKLRAVAGADAVAAFRAAAAAAATGVGVLAKTLADPAKARDVWARAPPGLHGAGWDALQVRLVKAAHAAQARVWTTMHGVGPESADGGGGGGGGDLDDVAAMRTYHHAAMLAGGLVESVEQLEKAVVSALDLPPVAADSAAPGDDEIGAAIKRAEADMDAALGPDVKPGAGETAAATPRAAPRDPNPHVAWLATMVAGLSGVLIWMRLVKALITGLRGLTSRDRFRAAFGGKLTFFGFKYWLVTSATLIACIVSLWKFPTLLYDLQVSTVFTVVAVCFQPMAEDSGWRAVVQVLFTLAGGALGYGVMLSPAVAACAPAVVALLVPVVFAGGHVNLVEPLKQPLFLGLSTYLGTLLCQFPKHSTPMFLAGKVVSTAVGALLTILASSLFFPRRASHDCLEKLGDALVAASDLLKDAWAGLAANAAASTPLDGGAGGGSKGAATLPLDTDAAIAAFRKDLTARVDAPLAAVHAAARVDTLPFHVPCVAATTDLVTPMPPAIHAMAAATDAVARRLAALALASGQEWRAGQAPELQAWAAARPLASPASATLVTHADGAVRAALDATAAAAAETRASLRAFGSRAHVLRARARVVAAVRDVETARVAMARALRSALPPIVQGAAAGRVTPDEDMALEAWVAAFVGAADALLAAARAACGDRALARDTYLGCL